MQGTGETSPYSGTVVSVRGVVVGDYEGASPNLRGWYIQDEGDGDPLTSDAIYVFDFDTATDQVSAGQLISITGLATEFSGQTQLTNFTLQVCGAAALPAPVDVSLPFANASVPERYEGMLVRLPQDLTVTDNFPLGRFGAVRVSANGRLFNPTNIITPGAPAIAQQAANNLNLLFIDDPLNNQNPDPVIFGGASAQLDFTNTLRTGYTTTNVIGVMTYGWGGNVASPNAYRVRPIVTPYFSAPANPRPAAPPLPPTTTLVVASANLLNFMNDIGSSCGTVGTDNVCRGATNAAEFARQWPKTVANIIGTGADVVGFMEMENDGYGPLSAMQFLADKLNAVAGSGTYTFINPDITNGVNSMGADAIKNGFYYKPGRIRQVQDALGRRIAVENVSAYAAPYQAMPEIDFVNAVLAEADCDLLLDVNNVFVNSINFGFDALDYLRRIPGERIAYLHIAGHYDEADDLKIDTHGTAVIADVWDLLAETVRLHGPRPTLLERDFNFPAFPELLAEVAMIRGVLRDNTHAGMRHAHG